MTKQTTLPAIPAELYDYDKTLEKGRLSGKWFFRVMPTPNHADAISIDIADFIGWMYETGRIDNWHSEGKGLVEINAESGYYCPVRQDFIETAAGTIHYTFQQFLRDCCEESDFINYLKSL